MSMMNANVAATTAMTANKPLDFELPEIGEAEFSNEELAEDMDGFTMSFPRIKIPAGGVLQFELPTGDPQHPDYSPTLTGVILFNHASCAYWPEGDEYSDDVPPLCSSVDGKQGYGEPGGVCEACALSQFGSASNGRGKACKNMRVLYLLRSGEFMPLAINLSPTSISPFREFLNKGFVFRNRATYGSLVEITLQWNLQSKSKSILSQNCSLCSCCPMRFWKSTMASALTASLWNVSAMCGAFASKAILHAKTSMKSLTTKRFDPMESCRCSIHSHL